jgi:hypothetical protein
MEKSLKDFLEGGMVESLGEDCHDLHDALEAWAYGRCYRKLLLDDDESVTILFSRVGDIDSIFVKSYLQDYYKVIGWDSVGMDFLQTSIPEDKVNRDVLDEVRVNVGVSEVVEILVGFVVHTYGEGTVKSTSITKFIVDDYENRDRL